MKTTIELLKSDFQGKTLYTVATSGLAAEHFWDQAEAQKCFENTRESLLAGRKAPEVLLCETIEVG